MNTIKQLLTASAFAAGMALWMSSFAQTTVDHGKITASQPATMTDGEVRKVDLGAAKVTIKHGEIKHMDMPGMTMVFTAKDKSLLAGIKPGDKIRFMLITEGGKMLITDIQPVG